MGSSWARFKAEWSARSFDYDDFNEGKWKQAFGSSSIRCLNTSTVYQNFRLAEACLMTLIFIWSVIDEWSIGCISYYLIFFTHWVLILTLAYFWCAWWTTRRAHQEDSPSYLPWYAKAAWLLQDACIPGAIVVAGLHWSLVVPTMSTGPSLVGYFTQGVNLLILILDIYLSQQPYYLSHGFVVVGLGAAYLGFSVIYWALEGTDCRGFPYIYPFLDWSQPERPAAAAAILMLLALPAVHVLLWLVIALCFPGNYRAPSGDMYLSMHLRGEAQCPEPQGAVTGPEHHQVREPQATAPEHHGKKSNM
mmetsp:Transcript_3972/g.11007  ORF Transcript_3972/g.11007 Transcript_3972/m.11007 type:complete len:305 (-) Transcript_3972:63-977(-)